MEDDFKEGTGVGVVPSTSRTISGSLLVNTLLLKNKTQEIRIFIVIYRAYIIQRQCHWDDFIKILLYIESVCGLLLPKATSTTSITVHFYLKYSHACLL